MVLTKNADHILTDMGPSKAWKEIAPWTGPEGRRNRVMTDMSPLPLSTPDLIAYMPCGAFGSFVVVTVVVFETVSQFSALAGLELMSSMSKSLSVGLQSCPTISCSSQAF